MYEIKIGYDKIDWDLLIDLYKDVDGVIGLARAGEIQTIKDSFKNSFKIVTIWDNNKIIGAGRILSDGYCYGWIHDIGVASTHRGLGIGKMVMDELMNNDKDLLYGLTSSFMAIDFYKKLGFKKHKTAMCKYPGKSDYLEEE